MDDSARQDLREQSTRYRLRSAFFYEKLQEYQTLALAGVVADLLPSSHLYNWDHRVAWGIREEAFTYIAQGAQLDLIQIFCHPRLLREHPRLIAYYRNIACISQKGMRILTGVDVSGYETDSENKRSLTDAQTMALVTVLNAHMSLLIETSVYTLTVNDVTGLLFASTGAQIDGSWRNAVGAEAEKVVQRLLIKEGITRKIIAGFLFKKRSNVEIMSSAPQDEQLGQIDRYRGMILTNQTSIIFSQDPDISLLDADGKRVGVIEVKGGLDAAGVLERYGAALKTFEDARRDHPGVATILIESIVTLEVTARLAQQSFIEHFLIGDILSASADTSDRFMVRVFSLLGIV